MLSLPETREILHAPFRARHTGCRIGLLAAGICLALVAADVALSSLLGTLFEGRDAHGRVHWHLAAYAARLLLAVSGIALLARSGLADPNALGMRRPVGKDAAWTLRAVITGGAVVTLLAAAGLAAAVAAGFEVPPPLFEAPGMLEGPWTPAKIRLLAALTVLALLAAPAAEEAVYRCLLLPALESFLPSWTAILAGAAVFAWLHVVPYGHGGFGTMPFMGGILTGWAFVARRSWLAAAIVHAAGNAWLALALVAQVWLHDATR